MINLAETETATDLDGNEFTVAVNPETGARKGIKLAAFSLIPPQALRALAEHFGKGALKYDKNNWTLGYDWSLSYDALCRHLTLWWEGEDNDPEFEANHLVAVMWHAVVLFTFATKEKYARFDDRLKD